MIALVASLAVLLSCSSEKRDLTAAERAILEEVGFDSVAVEAVAGLAGKVERFYGLSPGGDPIPGPGVTVELDEAEVLTAIRRTRSRLDAHGYGVFHSDQNFGFEPDRIAVLTDSDPYVYLRWVQVNGINYDVSHETVIDTLRMWDREFGLELIGGNFDWLNARFEIEPPDMRALAARVYAFCPDVVDHGTETIDRLAREMEKTGTLYCWWD